MLLLPLRLVPHPSLEDACRSRGICDRSTGEREEGRHFLSSTPCVSTFLRYRLVRSYVEPTPLNPRTNAWDREKPRRRNQEGRTGEWISDLKARSLLFSFDEAWDGKVEERKKGRKRIVSCKESFSLRTSVKKRSNTITCIRGWPIPDGPIGNREGRKIWN